MNQIRPFVFPPKKILVPLDLTDASVAAWKQAKSLAATFGAEVQGLFVRTWVYQGDIPVVEIEVKEILEDLRRRLGAGADVGSVSGSIEETILSWGRNLDYDMIVMGTHGRKGLAHAFMGSVAEAVVRASPVPVLVVREPMRQVRSILAPVNFEPYAQKGLEQAASVAQTLGARLNVLHVVSQPLYGGRDSLKGPKHLLADAVNKLSAQARAICKPKTALSFGDPAEMIAEAAKSADLIVLVAHRKGFLNDLVLGTTADRLLRHSETAILALPSEQPARPRRRPALRTLERL